MTLLFDPRLSQFANELMTCTSDSVITSVLTATAPIFIFLPLISLNSSSFHHHLHHHSH